MATAALPYINWSAFAMEVAEGLGTRGQKTLASSWLYDDIGSALFEVITLLPEYGLTRADAALLARYSGEIVREGGNPRIVIELGSGTGTKTRHLLSAAAPVEYFPVDISPSALASCAATLGEIRGVRVKPIEADYLEGIDLALAHRRKNEPAMILFLGSTIGNFSRTEAVSFLRSIRQRLKPGDSLLLGGDLVKPHARLISAYDDPSGVTAAFNLNLLGRINRELGGQFDIRQFAHEARYNERRSRVEMHIRSKIKQSVEITDLNRSVCFDEDETIWTESSHKFQALDLELMGVRSGWTPLGQWLDHEWGFAEILFGIR